MKKGNTVLTYLECPECAFEYVISRKESNQKKAGHIKHMYCPVCRKKQGFIEHKDKIHSSYFKKYKKLQQEG